MMKINKINLNKTFLINLINQYNIKLIGRKRKGDNKEGKHNKNDSDNIIKKCKAVLFKYIIIYVLDIVNGLRINKEEDECDNNEPLLEHKSRKKNRTKNIPLHRELQNINTIENIKSEKLETLFFHDNYIINIDIFEKINWNK